MADEEQQGRFASLPDSILPHHLYDLREDAIHAVREKHDLGETVDRISALRKGLQEDQEFHRQFRSLGQEWYNSMRTEIASRLGHYDEEGDAIDPAHYDVEVGSEHDGTQVREHVAEGLAERIVSYIEEDRGGSVSEHLKDDISSERAQRVLADLLDREYLHRDPQREASLSAVMQRLHSGEFDDATIGQVYREVDEIIDSTHHDPERFAQRFASSIAREFDNVYRRGTSEHNEANERILDMAGDEEAASKKLLYERGTANWANALEMYRAKQDQQGSSLTNQERRELGLKQK